MHLVAPRPANDRRTIRGAVAAGLLMGLAVACALLASPSARPVSEEQQEVMKAWADGMYPANAQFPPGYSFGDNNGVRPTHRAACGICSYGVPPDSRVCLGLPSLSLSLSLFPSLHCDAQIL